MDPLKKIVFIAHPVAGDIEKNLADLYRIIRKINFDMPDIIPFAPYVADVLAMGDEEHEGRRRGMLNGTAILESGIIEEIWLTGDRISLGMDYEIEQANVIGIPVVNKIGHQW